MKNSGLDPISTIMEEDAGLHFLMKVTTRYSDEEIVKRAAQQGIRISCLSQYYFDEKEVPEHILVINYVGIHPERSKEALDRLLNSLTA